MRHRTMGVPPVIPSSYHGHPAHLPTVARAPRPWLSVPKIVNWLQNPQPPQSKSLTLLHHTRKFTKFTSFTSFLPLFISLTPPTHPLRIAPAMSDPYIQSLFADR